MLVLHNGPAQVSSIHQRKGRTGYYITVATPKSLRAKLGNSIRKKVGNTHSEGLNFAVSIVDLLQRIKVKRPGGLDSFDMKLNSCGNKFN